MSGKSIQGFQLIYRGSAKRFSFYTYSQLIQHNVNLGGFIKEIKGTAFWFLYAKKEDFVFLNLMPTLLMLRGVVRILESVIFGRGKLMFVNNDLDLFWGAMNVATEIAEPFCVSRWVGGTLTNFKKLWVYFNRFLQFEKWSNLTRPSARLKFSLQGFAYLSAPPSLIFINSLKYSMSVANEAHAVFIPAISLVDIDTNSGDSAYLIPSNDDSEVSIDFFNKLFGQITLVNKFRLAKRFLAKKIKRADSFLNKKAMSFWERMFVFRENYENMHTKSFRLCLRNWIALSGFRKTFSGLFVHNFLNKKIEGFVFRCLRNKPYYHFKKLRTLRVLKNKAKNLYLKYYKRFFFFKNNKLSLKYSIRMEVVVLQLKWFLNTLTKLSNIKKWLAIRKKILNVSDIKIKFDLENIYNIVNVQYKKTLSLYHFFLKKKYNVLKNILEQTTFVKKENDIKSPFLGKTYKEFPFVRDNKKYSYRNKSISNNFESKMQRNRTSKFNVKEDVLSWDTLFRRTPQINKNIHSSGNIMDELRKKYKGIRYWIEVFKARPWLTVRKPLYFLHYPSNFRKFPVDQNLLRKFIRPDFVNNLGKSFKKQNANKENLILTYMTNASVFESMVVGEEFTPVKYMELIPQELHWYYSYIDFKYNSTKWNTWLNKMRETTYNQHIQINNKELIISDLLKYNFFNLKLDNIYDHNNFKDEKEDEEMEEVVAYSQKLSQPNSSNWLLKRFVRINAFNYQGIKSGFDWSTYFFAGNILSLTSFSKKFISFHDRALLMSTNYKHLNNYNKLRLKLISFDSSFYLKQKMKMSNQILNGFYITKDLIRHPLYVKTFYGSRVDKLARMQSNFYIKLNRKNKHQRSVNWRNNKNIQKNEQQIKSIQSNLRIKSKTERKKVSRLFNIVHWLRWLNRDITKIQGFAFNKLISKYIFIFKKLKKFKHKAKWHVSYNYLSFLLHRCLILILLKGLFISTRKNRRLFRHIMSDKFFKYSIHQKYFNTRHIFRVFYKLKKKKARWSSFIRAFFFNKALYFTTSIHQEKMLDPIVIADKINVNNFFLKSARKSYKKAVFNKLMSVGDQKWRHGFRWVPRYSGIPSRRASFFRMLETSKFILKRKRRLVLKPRKRIFGKTLLESYLKDFQYGRANNHKHYFIVKEILARIQNIKHKKWVVFMQMLKGNKLVSKPFIRSDIDKFSHPKIFLLRNFGSKKFKRIKRQETQDKVSFIKWYAKQQRRTRNFPGRMDTKYIMRLWTNKSMFFAN